MLKFYELCKFKSEILKSIYSYTFFSCVSINMSRIKLYQQNIIKKIKKDYKKKLLENIKIYLKKKKKKSDNMVVNVTKIFQKMKHKSLLSTEKILQNGKKCCIIKSNDS